ncbi:unnamed protein product [Ceratitis capitata]|uniref:(Mediterranean fruit fly) hypothetical protein n=1 Tax=Ceratitis capitata TaxID=7213 RepID=A0A811V6I4_CERCA|nr:unnamed protein product [Ceratitis capitata]
MIALIFAKQSTNNRQLLKISGPVQCKSTTGSQVDVSLTLRGDGEDLPPTLVCVPVNSDSWVRK